jgi:RNA-binding protein
MLTSKQRAQLRALANPIDTVLMVGKGGFSEQLYKTADEVITARELIKCKVLETSAYSSREAADMIAEKCGADVVQVIGSKFVLYRPNPKEPKIVLPKAKKKN